MSLKHMPDTAFSPSDSKCHKKLQRSIPSTLDVEDNPKKDQIILQQSLSLPPDLEEEEED